MLTWKLKIDFSLGLNVLLQRDPSQESLALIPMAVDFLQKNLASGRGQELMNGRSQSAADQLNLLTWSLGFFVLENYESEVQEYEQQAKVVASPPPTNVRFINMNVTLATAAAASKISEQMAKQFGNGQHGNNHGSLKEEYRGQSLVALNVSFAHKQYFFFVFANFMSN